MNFSNQVTKLNNQTTSARLTPAATPVPKGCLFIISGPSQIGKDSIVKALWRETGLNLVHIITYTTREKRRGERNHITYNFVSEDNFKKLIKKNQLLEWARVRQAYFGTPQKPVKQALAQGKNVILQIDVQGAAQIKAKLPQSILIFITAESASEVRRRIFASTRMSLKLKQSRWQEARRELKAQSYYDYVIINRFGKLKETVKEIKNIISLCCRQNKFWALTKLAKIVILIWLIL